MAVFWSLPLRFIEVVQKLLFDRTEHDWLNTQTLRITSFTITELKQWSSHLLTISVIVSYMHLAIFQVSSTGFKPMTSVMPVLCVGEVMLSNPVEDTWNVFRCTYETIAEIVEQVWGSFSAINLSTTLHKTFLSLYNNCYYLVL